jgi:hypothetical protein
MVDIFFHQPLTFWMLTLAPSVVRIGTVFVISGSLPSGSLCRCFEARVSGLAFRIVLRLQEGDTYEYLLDNYVKALREGSDLTTDLRGALLSSHRRESPNRGYTS